MSRILFAAKRQSQTQLDNIAHEQTIICRQLFAGHVVGSGPMKRNKNLLQMIMIMAQSIPSMPIPRGDLSGIYHLVSPGSGEFVRKPLLGGGAFVNSSGSD